MELIDAPPDFAEALSDVQAAVQADDAAAALVSVRRLVVAYYAREAGARATGVAPRRGRGAGAGVGATRRTGQRCLEK